MGLNFSKHILYMYKITKKKSKLMMEDKRPYRTKIRQRSQAILHVCIYLLGLRVGQKISLSLHLIVSTGSHG